MLQRLHQQPQRLFRGLLDDLVRRALELDAATVGIPGRDHPEVDRARLLPLLRVRAAHPGGRHGGIRLQHPGDPRRQLVRALGGDDRSWRDAEDGRLGNNPVAQGAVDSTIMVRVPSGTLTVP